MLLALAVLWGGSFFFNAVAVRELPSFTLVWMRVPGDVVFAVGCGFLALFAIKLATGARGRNVVVGSVAPTKR